MICFIPVRKNGNCRTFDWHFNLISNWDSGRSHHSTPMEWVCSNVPWKQSIKTMLVFFWVSQHLSNWWYSPEKLKSLESRLVLDFSRNYQVCHFSPITPLLKSFIKTHTNCIFRCNKKFQILMTCALWLQICNILLPGLEQLSANGWKAESVIVYAFLYTCSCMQL